MKLDTAFDHDIIPIPIRDDLIVYVQGIPWDMTLAEAAKIIAVIQALGQSSEHKLPPPEKAE